MRLQRRGILVNNLLQSSSSPTYAELDNGFEISQRKAWYFQHCSQFFRDCCYTMHLESDGGLWFSVQDRIAQIVVAECVPFPARLARQGSRNVDV